MIHISVILIMIVLTNAKVGKDGATCNDTHCASCAVKNKCDYCKTDYFYKDGVCKLCNVAFANCSTCSEQTKTSDPVTCLTCQGQHYFNNQSCVECKVAFEKCSLCEQMNTGAEVKCLKCDDTYYYSSQKCLTC